MVNFGFLFDYSWPLLFGFIWRPVAEWIVTLDTELVILLTTSFSGSIFSYWLVFNFLAQPRWITHPLAILATMSFTFILVPLADRNLLQVP